MGSMSNAMSRSADKSFDKPGGTIYKKAFFPVLVIALIAVLGVLGVVINENVVKPARYERHYESGLRHLEAMEYEEAIVELNKARDIISKDHRALVALSKVYSEMGDTGKAVEYAWLARAAKPYDEDLLLEVLDIVEPIDPLSAGFMLQDFGDRFSSRDLSSNVRAMLEDLDLPPELPDINLEGGRYIKPVMITLGVDEMPYGHAIYYSLDGNIPTRRALRYAGSFQIEDSMLLQYITYNPKGLSTETKSLYFEINHEMFARLENLIREAKDAFENTQVGVEVGDCIEGSKEMLGPVLTSAESIMDMAVITYDDAENSFADLNNMLYTFKQRIIVPTDRRLLREVIEEANLLNAQSQEGTTVGYYMQGSKLMLQMSIDEAAATLESLIARQYDIDNAVENLRTAIAAFHASLITVDNTRLNSTVIEATNLLNSAVEGTNVGNYRSGSKARLQNAINSANIVLNDMRSSQSEVDQSLEDLNRAIRDFRASIVTQDDRRIIDEGGTVGRVTVSLFWSSTDDLDLHVTSPRGDTVYYGNSNSSSGGRLDIDQQVSAPFVSNPIENIYWANPPSGTYTVVVNVYTKRSSGSIPARVRVIVDGVATEYNISISSGSQTVCTFRY